MNPSVHEIRHPIPVFSPAHLSFLAVLLPIAALTAFFLAKKIGFKRKVIWGGAILAMLCEIERLIFFMRNVGDGFRLPANNIPINHCPFQVVLLFILAMFEAPEKHKKLLSFMFPIMVGGGFIGMLLPGEALRAHGLSDFATYRYFFYHAMVICMGLYFYLSKPFEYKLKNYFMGLFFCFCTLFVGVWLNGFFGWDNEVNFMFVVRPPVAGLPILNFRNGWPGYMLDMLGIGFVLITSCYVPVIWREMPGLFKTLKNKFNRPRQDTGSK